MQTNWQRKVQNKNLAGYAAMNSASLLTGGQHGPSLPPPGLRSSGRQQLAAWRELLDRCARKPSRKRVHALRVATLRLCAALEHELRGQDADAPAVRAFKRWKKEAEKLRRALRPVRDCQVQRQRLAGVQAGILTASPGSLPAAKDRCLGEIQILDDRQVKRCQAKSEELLAWIEGRRKRLRRRSTELEELLAPEAMACGPDSTAEAALQFFALLASAFPRLSGANLHAYRRRLKNAVYLADLSAATDPLSLRLAKTFKKMTDAAGDWHDCQMLAEEAGRALPGQGIQTGLAASLKASEKDCLRKALALCRRSTVLLLINR
jgi:CHAD domain-containing protein